MSGNLEGSEITCKQCGQAVAHGISVCRRCMLGNRACRFGLILLGAGIALFIFIMATLLSGVWPFGQDPAHPTHPLIAAAAARTFSVLMAVGAILFVVGIVHKILASRRRNLMQPKPKPRPQPSYRAPQSLKYCLDCGTTGKSEEHTPGSFLTEIFLWLCFLVPGIIYSVWRLSARYQGCQKCGSKRIVPADSPVARGIPTVATLPGQPGTLQFCGQCGKQIPIGNRFCGHCGATQQEV